MAASNAAVSHALARMRLEPFADLRIARHLDQLCREAAHAWRDTLLTPLVTLRLFVLQVLHGNTSITHLRQLFQHPSASHSPPLPSHAAHANSSAG